jgi:GT2 family glycosyltransferase
VRLNRNDPNLGLSAHVNRVLAMARGEIIAVAAGDDISLPARVRETVAAFARHPEAMAVSFTDIRIDDSGTPLEHKVPSGPERIIDLEAFLAAGPHAQTRLGLSGASRAFRRAVYERFGDLLPDCPAEDTPYLRRALYLGGCVRCGGPGICYRIHSAQMSTPVNIATMKAQVFNAQYLADLAKLGELGITDLPLVRIRAHIEAEAIEFALRALKQSGQPPDLRLIMRMLPAKGFRMREKLGLTKRFLMRKGLT